MNKLPTTRPSVADYSSEVLRRFGDPFMTFKGKTTLNVTTIGRLFARNHDLFWDQQDANFYRPAASSSILEPISIETTTDLLRDFVTRIAKRESVTTGSLKLGASMIHAILGVVKSESPFPDYSHQNLFPVANGVVRFGVGELRRLRGRVEFGFKHRCPVTYNPRAQCPQFLQFLAQILPDQADQRLLQMYMGGAFTGLNSTRRILLIRGPSVSGKTTLLRIQEFLLGRDMVGDLRSDMLDQRFEKSFFVGKRQLSAKDVPADALQRRSAKSLKHLSGGDITQAEQKFAGKTDIRGSFFIVISSNGDLRLNLENDETAWIGRLAVLDFKKPLILKRVADFAENLLATEGEGILNFFIEGGQEFLREVRKHGDIKLTIAQTSRVLKLVMASKSLEVFVYRHIAVTPGSSLSNDMIIRKYAYFCRQQGFTPVSSHVIYARLPDLMLHMRGATRNISLTERFGTSRAYGGVSFVGI